MTLRDANRLLLIPALIVLGSLTVASCASTPDSDSSSSSRDDRDDEKDEADDEEDEEADDANGCPPGFLATLEAADTTDSGDYSLIGASEFAAPEVGDEFLAGGCLVQVTVTTEGAESVSSIGYIPGGPEEMAAIGANLEAAGYEKLTDGVYSQSDDFGVFVIDLAAAPETAEGPGLDELGFGPATLMVMAVQS